MSLFRPVTKWGDMVTLPGAAPEMVRKAFKQAETERPGATFLILPEDVAERRTDGEPLPVNVPRDPAPSEDQVHRAIHVLAEAEHPVVLAGAGVARDGAMDALAAVAANASTCPSRRRSWARACSPTTTPTRSARSGSW